MCDCVTVTAVTTNTLTGTAWETHTVSAGELLRSNLDAPRFDRVLGRNEPPRRTGPFSTC